jgi:hypothetical protein
MRELMKDPEGGDFAWRRLQYVFDELPNPHEFPQLAFSLEDSEVELLRRFIDQARNLASSTLLSAEDNMRVSIEDFTDVEHVETDFSDPDITSGFMVLLRQCYADGDEASFSKVWKTLNKRLYENGEEELLAVLKHWKKAHATLKRQGLEELVQEQMVEDKLMPGTTVGPDGQEQSAIVRDPAPPHELLQTFWYGGQIHWGNNREALATLQKDPFDAAYADMSARAAALDFASFYTGFAVLLERALGIEPATSS